MDKSQNFLAESVTILVEITRIYDPESSDSFISSQKSFSMQRITLTPVNVGSYTRIDIIHQMACKLSSLLKKKKLGIVLEGKTDGG